MASSQGLAGLGGARDAVLLDQPFGVVAVDELPDGGAQIRDVSVDGAMDDLSRERASESLGVAVGLGLGDEGVGRLDTT